MGRSVSLALCERVVTLIGYCITRSMHETHSSVISGCWFSKSLLVGSWRRILVGSRGGDSKDAPIQESGSRVLGGMGEAVLVFRAGSR